MERNTLTPVASLLIGDRFYRANDRHKTVLTKVENESKQTHYRTYSHWFKKDGDRWPQAINGETMVVFLRHSQINK